MALRYHTDMPSFSSVGAGQTATIDLPATGVYYDCTLEYRESGSLAAKADTEAAITEIRVKINGEVQRRYSAEELYDLNQYHGISPQDGYLPIFFAEPWMRDPISEDALAWGMNDVQSFQIEVDIDSGATSPTLSAVATKTRENRNLGAIKKIRKFNVSVAGTGITNFQTLPRLDSYCALHAHSANIDDVKVTVDNVEIFDLTDDQVEQHTMNQPELTPISGWFHVDFSPTRRIQDLLPMVSPKEVDKNGRVKSAQRVQDFQVDFNMSSAASFDLLTETIGTV